ncbi:hypothetical protein NP493_215g03019 [Ridgeia piscesae]|uniref:Uncharacterized protein n=1 Tax=Ridgeia piscesae TaxID=27915 RepID=A0AAD9P0Q1_RIDPI|nr:hypothetical protein NP493_215g03019 [Ridgeia piscesae]
MEMPDIHMCAQLTYLNDQLKRRVKQLKRQNTELLQQLADVHEQQRVDSLMRQYVTTRDSAVQTDPVKFGQTSRGRGPVVKKTPTQQQPNVLNNERLNKVLGLYNNLMKRYDKELKVNEKHTDTIAKLNLKVIELEDQLAKKQVLTPQVEARNRMHQRTNDITDSEDLTDQLKKTRCERDQLREEVSGLKAELKGLDHGFFEEIEDMKYALQQSARLNKEYEKLLRRLCNQFGLPYPYT